MQQKFCFSSAFSAVQLPKPIPALEAALILWGIAGQKLKGCPIRETAPGAAPNGSTPQRRRQPVNDPDKEDQSQRNGSGLVPRIVIHGKNQRRTDAARAHQSQNRRLPGY